MQRIKVPQFIKNIFSPETRVKWRQLETDFYWFIAGMPNPPVPSYKRILINKWTKNFPREVFVETGTYGGDTVEKFRKKFKRVYSIELDLGMAEKAQNRFKNNSNVEIIQGDSSKVLPEILKKIDAPVVFWLDGHYSGSGTAKSDLETPIIKELESIFLYQKNDFIILIDDARCFIGKNDYPTVLELKEFVNTKFGFCILKIVNDIIIITKEDDK